MPHECISDYLARALSMATRTSMSLCDSRGANTDGCFTLKDVPEGVDLSAIPGHIAHYHGVDETLVSASGVNDSNRHVATLHAGGRIRMPHSTISVTRDGRRVLVNIAPFKI